jgi:hypothetical protein
MASTAELQLSDFCLLTGWGHRIVPWIFLQYGGGWQAGKMLTLKICMMATVVNATFTQLIFQETAETDGKVLDSMQM